MPPVKAKPPGSLLGALVKWTAIVLFLVLLAFNLGNFLLYKKLEPIFSREMGDRQAFMAEAVASAIRASRIRSYIADNDGLYGGLLKSQLDELREAGKLTSVVLLDTSGIVLYSSGGNYEKGEFFDYLAIDKAAFNSALSGIPSYTELYKGGDSYIRGAYAPVENELGETAWILGLEAGAEYHSALAALKRNLLLFFILSIIVAALAGGVLLSAAFELNRMGKRLVRASMLSSIGEMAAGVAHEVRNPLAIIRGAAERLPDADGKTKTQLIEYITDETSRINDILETYLSFARPADDLTILDPIVTAEQIANRIRNKAAKSNIEIEIDKSVSDPVKISENGLRRCILNIYLNAIEAMPDGGQIKVAATKDDNNLRLSISDNGPGMDKKTVARIFEPFITTKSGGTGLGLTLSRRIVESAGGSITVETKPGEGCCFTITMPVADT